MQATIDFTLTAPCGHPNGLDWYQGDLWLVCGDRRVFLLNPQTGDVQRSLETPGHAGVMYDGRHLWVVDSPPPKIYQVDPETGVTLRTLDPTGPVPIGLAWDGEHIWCGEHHHGICRVDPAANHVLAQFPGQGERTHDLAWDGEALWFVDTNLRMFYRMDTITGDILRSFPSPGDIEPHGLTWDGNTLWFTQSEPDRIHRLRLEG